VKKCTKCKIEKPINSFGKNAKFKDRLSIYCRECIREKSKKRYIKDKEKIKNRSRKYAREHKEERKIYQDKYYKHRKQKGERGNYIIKVEKKCYKCKEIKPINIFNKRTASKDGHDNICKPCQKLRDKERYYANREKEIQRSKDYQKRNPDKAYKSKKKFRTLNDLAGWDLYKWANAVKARDKNICQECGISNELEAHHIKSKSEHPKFALILDNGITLCKSCHEVRHYTTT
jgi:5-methylcytosine-specific restriction endonuclease McrA